MAVSDPSPTFNTDLLQTIETRKRLGLAEASTVGALARDEFRGAHWRAEHQERKDDEWLKHTLLSWNDGSPELWYRPVILEGEEKPTSRKPEATEREHRGDDHQRSNGLSQHILPEGNTLRYD